MKPPRGQNSAAKAKWGKSEKRFLFMPFIVEFEKLVPRAHATAGTCVDCSKLCSVHPV
jgi:hypothetical protein